MKQNPSLIILLEQVGKKMHHIRHTRNEKLNSVENSTGISHSIISRIEHGSYLCLSFEMLVRLLDYYNADLREILS